MRINGELTRVTDAPVIKPDDMVQITKEIMQERTWDHFEETNEADFAYSIPNLGRFRVNAYRQRSTIGMVFRLVRSHARSFGELNLPEAVRRLADEQRGSILVTGRPAAARRRRSPPWSTTSTGPVSATSSRSRTR